MAPRNGRRPAPQQPRRLRMEPLEDRWMLSLGVAGDSLSDEYAEQWYGSFSQNWVESLGENGVDLGRYRAEPTPWPDVRQEGFEYNWSDSGATSASLLAQGQHTGLAQQVDDGLVTQAVLTIGQNDFLPLGPAYMGIYFGIWGQDRIDAHNEEVLENIHTAVATLAETGVDLVLSNVIDYGVAPAVRLGAPNVAGRQRVGDAIGELNDRLEVLARDYQIPLVDSFGLSKAYLGENGAEIAWQRIGGVKIRNTAGVDPHNAFVLDGVHPHTVLQAGFANAFVEAVNLGYSANLGLFSEKDMLTLAGIGDEYTGDTLGIDYSDYVILPPAGTGSVGDFVWHDSNGDGLQDDGTAADVGIAGVVVELVSAGSDGAAGGVDDVSLGVDVTDANGFYRFSNLPSGVYYLRFSDLPAGYDFTVQDAGVNDALDSDADPTGQTAVFPLAVGQADRSRDAGIELSRNGKIRGGKWHDIDLDGHWDPGEPGLEGWTIFLDGNQDGRKDPGERSTTTDPTGHYAFDNLSPGDYVVAEELQSGWDQTFPHILETGGTERVSVAYDGLEGDDWSGECSTSTDGRFVAFSSLASNLVPGDGPYADVFVYDRGTNTVEVIGPAANDDSYSPSISGDGRYTAFHSSASNLVAGDTNGADDIFVYDRLLASIVRVSKAHDGSEANGASGGASISADGRYVAFESSASNLVLGDTNDETDIFVYDRLTGTIERVSVASDGSQATSPGDGSHEASISDDGRYIAFSSHATNLVSDDDNGQTDIFVRDRQTETTERVSIATDGSQADGPSSSPSMNTDGRYVAFESSATSLVPDDTKGHADVFVYDRVTKSIERVSVASDGSEADDWSKGATISDDGRYVAFSSNAPNLVPGDANAQPDVFLLDRLMDAVERVSVAHDGLGPNGGSDGAALSGDGRYVAFGSSASNLVSEDGNSEGDVFVVGITRSGSHEVTLESREVEEDVDFGNSRTVDLGAITFRELDGLDAAAGEAWYRLVTSRTGFLTVEAMYDPAGGTAELTLFDGDLLPIGDSSGGTGHERIDHQAGAGEVYCLKLDGPNGDAALRLSNLVHHHGTTVAVYGSNDGDAFELDTGASRLVTINGVEYVFTDSEAASVTFDGLSGDDTAVFYGTGAADWIKLWPGPGDARGNYTLAAMNVESVTADGGGGRDVAQLYDSAGPDTFQADPDSAQMSGPGFLHTVNGFPYIHAYASDDAQTDTGILTGLSGSADWLRGRADHAYVRGTGFYSRANGFDVVQANATDPTDVAQLYDSPGADRLAASPPSRTTMTYEAGNSVKVNDYQYVHAYASPGAVDTAHLQASGSPQSTKFLADLLADGRHRARLSSPGNGFLVQILCFEAVRARGTSGDLALLYDSPGADVFEASASQATMTYEDGATVEVKHVQYVHAFASDDGQTDAARLIGDHQFQGRHGESKMYGPSNHYFNRAKGFDEVIASSVPGGGTAYLFDSPLDDVYSSRPGQSKIEYNDGTSVEVLNFGPMYSFSRNGGFDTATFYDETLAGAGHDLTFRARDTFGELGHGSHSLYSHFSRAWEFEEIRVVFTGDDDYVYLYDDPTRVDHLVIPFLGDPGHAPAKARFYNSIREIYIDDFYQLTATTSQSFVDDKDIDPAYAAEVILQGKWADA